MNTRYLDSPRQHSAVHVAGMPNATSDVRERSLGDSEGGLSRCVLIMVTLRPTTSTSWRPTAGRCEVEQSKRI